MKKIKIFLFDYNPEIIEIKNTNPKGGVETSKRMETIVEYYQRKEKEINDFLQTLKTEPEIRTINNTIIIIY